MSDTIEIPFSRIKSALLLFGATALIVLGMLFAIEPGKYVNAVIREPGFIRVIGIVTIVFFGLCLAFIASRLISGKTGLTIDKDGITDHSSASSVGRIEWADIERVETLRIASTKILLLYTDKPEKYLSQSRNQISRKVMEANYRKYGSPLSINANALKISYEQLEKLIRERLDSREGPNEAGMQMTE